jgi:hypothetical protein
MQQRQVQRCRGGHEQRHRPEVGARITGQRQQHPDCARDRRRPAEPDPGGVAHHGECRGGDEQKVHEQAGQRGVLGLHQGGRDEGADDAHRADQLAVAQRDAEPDHRGRRHQHEADQRRHQLVHDAGAVGRAEQHRNAARGKARGCEVQHRLLHRLAPAEPLGADDQCRAQQGRQHAARRGSEQALVHRVAHQEYPGHQQRGRAEPHAPACGQQRLDVRPARGRRGGGDGFGRRLGLGYWHGFRHRGGRGLGDRLSRRGDRGGGKLPTQLRRFAQRAARGEEGDDAENPARQPQQQKDHEPGDEVVHSGDAVRLAEVASMETIGGDLSANPRLSLRCHCHCEGRSDEAIPVRIPPNHGIASSRCSSQ